MGDAAATDDDDDDDEKWRLEPTPKAHQKTRRREGRRTEGEQKMVPSRF